MVILAQFFKVLRRELDLLYFDGNFILFCAILVLKVRDDQFHDGLISYSILFFVLLNDLVCFQSLLVDYGLWVYSSLLLERCDDLAALPVILENLQVLQLLLLAFHVSL